MSMTLTDAFPESHTKRRLLNTQRPDGSKKKTLLAVTVTWLTFSYNWCQCSRAVKVRHYNLVPSMVTKEKRSRFLVHGSVNGACHGPWPILPPKGVNLWHNRYYYIFLWKRLLEFW